MILHKESHTDHVPAEVLAHVLNLFGGRDGFFIETIELPAGMTVSCGLYGPAMGGPPVPEEEVHYQCRDLRTWNSRMVMKSPRPVRTLTVVAGPYDGNPCVLYTVYGGPCAPREPHDPNLPASERASSEAFWSQHALSE